MMVTTEEYQKLKEGKVKYTSRCKKKFYSRMYNHINTDHIKVFYEKYLIAEYSDRLFELQYKNKFTLYLYIYLKSKAIPYDLQDKIKFNVSQPLEVNISEISRLAHAGRNTVKRALKELIQLGLLLEMIPDKRKSHNEFRQVMLLNDYHLIGYNKKQHKIIY